MQTEIRPFAPEDREALRRFLSWEPAANVYLLALLPVERAAHAAFWVARQDQVIVGALMRAGVDWLPGLPLPLWVPAVSQPDCVPGFAALFEAATEPHLLNGPAAIADAIAARIRRASLPEPFSLDTLAFDPGPPKLPVQRARAEDLPEIARLHAEDASAREEWVRRFQAVPRRAWYARGPDGEVVASAHTHVETEAYAMVGGVYTRPSARGQGWAGACVTALAAELRAEEKLPCLYHENRGRLYHRLGFRPVAPWRVGQVPPLP